jgi:hypothetical protein
MEVCSGKRRGAMLHGTGTGEGKADMLSDIDFHRRGKAGHEGGGGKRRVLEPVDVQAGAAERQGAWWRGGCRVARECEGRLSVSRGGGAEWTQVEVCQDGVRTREREPRAREKVRLDGLIGVMPGTGYAFQSGGPDAVQVSGTLGSQSWGVRGNLGLRRRHGSGGSVCHSFIHSV